MPAIDASRRPLLGRRSPPRPPARLRLARLPESSPEPTRFRSRFRPRTETAGSRAPSRRSPTTRPGEESVEATGPMPHRGRGSRRPLSSIPGWSPLSEASRSAHRDRAAPGGVRTASEFRVSRARARGRSPLRAFFPHKGGGPGAFRVPPRDSRGASRARHRADRASGPERVRETPRRLRCPARCPPIPAGRAHGRQRPPFRGARRVADRAHARSAAGRLPRTPRLESAPGAAGRSDASAAPPRSGECVSALVIPGRRRSPLVSSVQRCPVANGPR